MSQSSAGSPGCAVPCAFEGIVSYDKVDDLKER